MGIRHVIEIESFGARIKITQEGEEAVLHDWFVPERDRKCGIGTAMLHAAISVAEIEGFKTITIVCPSDKIPYFERNGFRETKEHSVHGVVLKIDVDHPGV